MRAKRIGANDFTWNYVNQDEQTSSSDDGMYKKSMPSGIELSSFRSTHEDEVDLLEHENDANDSGLLDDLKYQITRTCSVLSMQSLLILIFAFISHYGYKSNWRMSHSGTGLPIPSLLFLKSLTGFIAAGYGGFLWYKHELYELNRLYWYLVSRVVDFFICGWLFLALLLDYGFGPFTKSYISSKERILYFCVLFLVCGAMTFSPRNLHKTYNQYSLLERLIQDDPSAIFHESSSGEESEESEDDSEEDEEVDDVEWNQQRNRNAADTDGIELSMNGSNNNSIRNRISPVQNSPVNHRISPPPVLLPKYVDSYHSSYQADDGILDNLMWQQQQLHQQQYYSQPKTEVKVSPVEFKALWESMAVTGNFNCYVSRVPSVEELTNHLAPCGMRLMASGFLPDENCLKVYFFAQEFGTSFLAEFVFDMSNLRLDALFKCQNPEKTPEFVQLLQFQHLFTMS